MAESNKLEVEWNTNKNEKDDKVYSAPIDCHANWHISACINSKLARK